MMFKRLRPLFRARFELLSNVNGRLTESIGGIRVVKAYTAERREDLVFARNVHKLFRNIAQSMTGVSFSMAFSSMIIGIIGLIVFVYGGQSVLQGRMTLGDLFMYIAFTGMMAMPVVELGQGAFADSGFLGDAIARQAGIVDSLPQLVGQ